jgi:hypothetical protein
MGYALLHPSYTLVHGQGKGFLPQAAYDGGDDGLHGDREDDLLGVNPTESGDNFLVVHDASFWVLGKKKAPMTEMAKGLGVVNSFITTGCYDLRFGAKKKAESMTDPALGVSAMGKIRLGLSSSDERR